MTAEADGWRMTINRPTSRETIGPQFALCYEVSATSREPDVAFEVTLLKGATTAAGPIRVAGGVGRGSVRVDLGDAGSGTYDLRVQLWVNGSPLDGAVVTARSVNLVRGTPVLTCP